MVQMISKATTLSSMTPLAARGYVPFEGSYNADNAAFAHEDLRILIMQITTEGEFSGQAFLQVFANADQTSNGEA